MSLLHRFLATGAPVPPANYIEDVFSTWLIKPPADFTNYSINNNIDLLGKGGMTWFKARDAAQNNIVYDTARGSSSGNANALITNGTQAQQTSFWDFVTPNSNGFTVNFASGGGQLTNGGINYASWSLRQQAKFFAIATWTGNGANRTIAHTLGAVPGCIIVKRTDAAADWQVYHTSLANTEYLVLNTTAAKATGATRWNSTTPTASVFSLGTDASVNASGGTYVAFIFAHNAGGFGLTGTDNVISCGSYTGTGAAGNAITLGYEPQWILAKASSAAQYWQMFDVMRGMPVGSSNDSALYPNVSNAEAVNENGFSPTATGFVTDGSNNNLNGVGYIYIAIRRGPMKVPTLGTSVFGLNARTGTGANATVTGSAGVSDAVLIKNRGSAVGDLFASRLTGTGYLETSSSAAEVAAGTTILQANPWDVMDGVKVGTTSTITNASANTYINYLFDRAPGFFDVVCYTGNDTTGRLINHSLAAVPELIICKARNGASTDYWWVYHPSLSTGQNLKLESNAAPSTGGVSYDGPPTSTVFKVRGAGWYVNNSGTNYVAYLFATCPGVSKVGSYTGNGSSQTINCGFTTGARFVLIKRTDSTGNWVVADSARGLVAAADPALYLNSTAAEVTGVDWIDPDNSGFIIIQEATFNLNVNGASYIYLAIA